MTAAARMQRAKALVGRSSALSNPVIIGFAAQGFVLTMAFSRSTWQAPLLTSLAAALGSLAASCGLLLITRRIAGRRGWTRPRPIMVLASLSAASVLRSTISVAIIEMPSSAVKAHADSLGRTIAALFVSLAICIGLAAITQLARERGALLASLLAEQSRLRGLADSMEQDLLRAEVDLRVRASALLEPTIAEIRAMLDGEVSPDEAARIATRISASVNDVVRPASRVLAVSPSISVSALAPLRPARLDLRRDRMDVAGAIRPGWVLLLTWVTVIPAPLIVGMPRSAIAVGLAASLVFWILLQVTKLMWPPHWRSLTILPGLGILFAVFFLGNLLFQLALVRSAGGAAMSQAWTAITPVGLVLRIAIAMLVVVLAMLDEHGRQSRAALAELNAELEELIAQLRRQTWLLHRSVALAVHGPVQSALVSTAMRLASSQRTQASVDDARRRLDQALMAISRQRHEDVSIDDALDDLRGLWQGVVRIDVDIDAGARSRLAADTGLRRCVIEVCRESASNAIRHGRARTVAISIVESAGRIGVQVRDDGTGLGSPSPAGLGTAMLDDTCLRWSLRDAEGGGAELIATVV